MEIVQIIPKKNIKKINIQIKEMMRFSHRSINQISRYFISSSSFKSKTVDKTRDGLDNAISIYVGGAVISLPVIAYSQYNKTYTLVSDNLPINFYENLFNVSINIMFIILWPISLPVGCYTIIKTNIK
jgi:hypothetical protein